MAFNPNDHMMLLKNKQYLPVNARVAWFRDEHPDWTISTSFASELSGSDYATFRCDILDATGRVIASGHKTEHAAHFSDFREKAETGAIGRALALCGYGTLFAQELETPITPDGDQRICDAPIEPRKNSRPVSKTPLAPPVASPDGLALAGNIFKSEVERFEPGVTGERLKQVFRILSKNSERSEDTLKAATHLLRACSAPDLYQHLLRTLGTGDDAPF